MRTPRPWRWWGSRAAAAAVLLSSFFLFPSSFLTAQEPRPFRSEVNFIRVDMHATADGKPVTDLQQSEIDVLEDGVPQAIVQFEQVSVPPYRPQSTRREPSSTEEMRRAAKDPRTRVMVLFIDPRFVDALGAIQARRPLIDALNQLVGGDDLIAVMTPSMSPEQLTFTRRTGSIEELLAGQWGEKGWAGITDPEEVKFEVCYGGATEEDRRLVADLVARYREVKTLDALDGLVEHLGALREERKAVIAVTDGWPLYGPDRSLTRPLKDPAGGQRAIPPPRIGRDPRTGRPTADADPSTIVSNLGLIDIDRSKCENDRVELAELRNEARFISMMQSANRANVSFYPVDPKRLFSGEHTLIYPRSLEIMASITDGLMLQSRDVFEAGLRRIVDDLSSYYLIGYNSNAKPDGKFHRITVRVKRPGVEVRARAGYLAATAEEAARSAVPLVTSVETSEMQMVATALAPLAAFSRDVPLRVAAAAAWTQTGAAVIRGVAEVTRSRRLGDDWSQGGQVEAVLLNGDGEAIATAAAPLEPGAFAAPLAIAPPTVLAPGDYRLRVSVRGKAALGSTETVILSLDAAPLGTGVMFLRRGASTGNQEVGTADRRFRRTERLIVETPLGIGNEASARLLGRAGNAIAIPVTASIREDADGTRWRRAEMALAPLAAGDYVVEISGGSERTLAGFRLVP